VTWQAVAGATGYNLRVDDLTAGASYFVWQPGLTGTSYTATTLTAGHACRVWLQAVNASGGGPWSAFNFTAGAPAATVGTGPPGPAGLPARAGAVELAADEARGRERRLAKRARSSTG